MIVPIEAGEITMAMTAAERVRAVRERRRRREIQLTAVLHEDDMVEIARRGYEDDRNFKHVAPDESSGECVARL